MLIDSPPPAVVLAVGERPDWRIERSGDMLVMRQSGQPPIVAKRTMVRPTPMATRIAGRDDDGRTLTIAVTFGDCRLPATNRRTSHIAMVAYGDLRLRGCFVGPVPRERPLLD